jgi:hypothetical protein
MGAAVICPSGRLPRWAFSFMELRNVRHRSEQPLRLIGKRQEALALIEAAGGVILRVDDDGERCDLAVIPRKHPGPVMRR